MVRIIAKSVFLLGICALLSCLAILIRGPFEFMRAPTPVEMVMPAMATALSPQELIETRDTGFTLRHPGIYDYTPSESAKSSSTQHVIWDGIVPRVWYEYAPSDAAELMPLVILFHGAARDGLSMIDMWQETARTHGLALAAPTAPHRQTWPFEHPNPALIHTIIRDMSGRHSIDPNKIFLFGHSNGAGYAQVLLNRTIGPWKAAALHAGVTSPSNLRIPKEAKPIRLYLGTQDGIFDLSKVRIAASDLAKAGHPTQLRVIQSHTHWFYEIGPQIAKQSWDWFRTL